jgi:hypothetical protein
MLNDGIFSKIHHDQIKVTNGHDDYCLSQSPKRPESNRKRTSKSLSAPLAVGDSAKRDSA